MLSYKHPSMLKTSWTHITVSLYRFVTKDPVTALTKNAGFVLRLKVAASEIQVYLSIPRTVR